jgi:hypothetical protein
MKKTSIFSPTLESKFVNLELWSNIEQLNLVLISDRMLIKHKWTQERTVTAIDGYRKYLYLTQVFQNPISPTSDVDSIWHEHILHTNKYAIDCQKVFGKFLHHFPTPSKWKAEQLKKMNCQSPCCNHADCCNDNPSLNKPKREYIFLKTDAEVGHENLSDKVSAMITNNCAPIGGSDSKCSGTTNCGNGADSRRTKQMNFDQPDMNVVPKSESFEEIAPMFFS